MRPSNALGSERQHERATGALEAMSQQNPLPSAIDTDSRHPVLPRPANSLPTSPNRLPHPATALPVPCNATATRDRGTILDRNVPVQPAVLRSAATDCSSSFRALSTNGSRCMEPVQDPFPEQFRVSDAA